MYFHLPRSILQIPRLCMYLLSSSSMFEIQWICLTVDYHLVKVYVVWLWKTFCSNIILTAPACTKWLHLAEWSHMGVAFSICLAFPTLSFTFPFLLSHTLTVIYFSLFIHLSSPKPPATASPHRSQILTHLDTPSTQPEPHSRGQWYQHWWKWYIPGAHCAIP